MKVTSARLVCFSPTRTTERVLEAIAAGTAARPVRRLDLTSPKATGGTFDVPAHELAIVGAPVYGGRIPPEAARRLRRVKGNLTAAVVVVVYGNRVYEDALLELRDLVTETGFVPVAAGAFLGEHSFSTEAVPLAHGRPDAQDARGGGLWWADPRGLRGARRVGPASRAAGAGQPALQGGRLRTRCRAADA